LRTTLIKYYFGNIKGVNVSAVYNINGLFVDIGFLIYFIYLSLQGFEYKYTELLIATFGGSLFAVSQYLIAFVNIRGKAGTSDALIET